MLVLTRKAWESTTITLPDGRTVSVMPTLIGNDRVRLSFDAPRDVRIMRSEVPVRPVPAEASTEVEAA